MAMKRNTQRIIAGVLVFLMIAALFVGIFASQSASDPASTQSYPVSDRSP
jgi:hypothetical protein